MSQVKTWLTVLDTMQSAQNTAQSQAVTICKHLNIYTYYCLQFFTYLQLTRIILRHVCWDLVINNRGGKSFSLLPKQSKAHSRQEEGICQTMTAVTKKGKALTKHQRIWLPNISTSRHQTPQPPYRGCTHSKLCTLTGHFQFGYLHLKVCLQHFETRIRYTANKCGGFMV